MENKNNNKNKQQQQKYTELNSTELNWNEHFVVDFSVWLNIGL